MANWILALTTRARPADQFVRSGCAMSILPALTSRADASNGDTRAVDVGWLTPLKKEDDFLTPRNTFSYNARPYIGVGGTMERSTPI